jgi:transposase
MGALLKETDVAAVARVAARSVRRRACELRTEASADTVRNGRRPRVYQLESLSPKLQRTWLAQQAPAEAGQPERPRLEPALTPPTGPNLSVEDREEALRKYRIIEPVVEPERFRLQWAENGCQKNRLIESLAKRHEVSRRTLYTWLKEWRDNGLPGLVTKDRSDKGFARRLNGAALDFILAAALPRPGVYGEMSVREIHRAYEEERAWRAEHATTRLGEFELRKYARYIDANTGRLSAAAQLPEASYETFRFWYGRIPEAVKAFARLGDEAFHNTQEILSFRDLESIQPLDYLVMDHRQLDIFCMVQSRPGWRLIRPWLTAGIDMRTRKWLAWAIVETPSSDSIVSVLKRVFIEFGLPRSVYWDNGKDFTCEWLEGRTVKRGSPYRIAKLDDGMHGVLDSLGVRIHHAIIKRARSKIIEPNFINIANFDRSLCWWCGHRASSRPERFEKLVAQHKRWIEQEIPDPPFPTIEMVANLYDSFLDALNEREHSGEGMQKITPTGRGWMCPNEAWERLIPGVEVRRAPAEVIQFCFHKRRLLTVRHGEVRASFGGRIYHYRFADDSRTLMAWNGRQVEFAYDPHDLGTAALYSEGTFLGLVANLELRRMGEDAFVADEKDRRASRRQVKQFVEAVHRSIPMATPEERAARRAAVRPARLAGKAGSAVDVPVPPAITAAVEAAGKQKSFRFADVEPAIPSRTEADTTDDEFKFFAEDHK